MRSALKKKRTVNKSEPLSEVKLLLGSIIFILVLLKVMFYKEPTLSVMKTGFSFWYLTVLPGYAFVRNSFKKSGVLEKMLLSLAVGASLLGILSYYLGLLGIHVKYHAYIIPPALILTGVLIGLKNKDNKDEDSHN